MISFIIPIYNAGSRLSPCLDSVLQQTYPSFEALLIDDGSTDDSARICQEYVAKDPRFILLQKDNGGEYSARNYGLQHAHGEYICYLDADDYLLPDYLQSLAAKMEQYPETDLIIQGITRIEGDSIIQIMPEGEGLFSLQPRPDAFFSSVNVHRLGFSFSKIFRTSLIREHQLQYSDKIVLAVDLDFLLRYLQYCKIVLAENVSNYQYIVHPASLTTTIHSISQELSGLMQLRSSWHGWTDRFRFQALVEKQGRSLALLVQRCIIASYKPGISFAERRRCFAQIPKDCVEDYYAYIAHYTLFLWLWRYLFYHQHYLLLDALLLFVYRLVYKMR